MCPAYGGEWRAWIRRHAAALTVGLTVPAGLRCLWNAGYPRTVSALSLLCLGSTTMYVVFNTRQKINANHLVVITGCDSGLGYSLALHCRALGATVLAGVLEPDGKTAVNLTENGVAVRRLDLTDHQNVEQFGEHVKELLSERKLALLALVNNAAVMILGEFEWQTAEQVQQQVAVNLLGTMGITRKLMPLVRANRSRIVMITSHCAYESLPGLSVYGATKAALLAWSTSLRTELAKYGVKIVSFIPGSFVSESNIMARQRQHFETMERSMPQEARNFYGDYFVRYARYFSSMHVSTSEPKRLTNSRIYEIFDDALLDVYPSAVYKCEPWSYLLYHALFKSTPTWMRDRLMSRFVRVPSWTR